MLFDPHEVHKAIQGTASLCHRSSLQSMTGADQHESGARFWYATMRITPYSYYQKRFHIDPDSIRASQALTPEMLNKITEDLDSLAGLISG